MALAFVLGGPMYWACRLSDYLRPARLRGGVDDEDDEDGRPLWREVKEEPLDVRAYLERVGLADAWDQGSLTPDRRTLEALVRAHLDAIPFENLDVMSKLAIRLDLRRAFEKIVRARVGRSRNPRATSGSRRRRGCHNANRSRGRGGAGAATTWIVRAPGRIRLAQVVRRRGGFCFEMNLLLGAVLLALGFDARYGLARVWRPEAPGSLASNAVDCASVLSPRGHTADGGRGGAAAATWIVRGGGVAAAPRREYSVETSRGGGAAAAT